MRTRSGTHYKPAAIRAYEHSLKRFVIPEFGNVRLSALTRVRIQQWADRLVTRGLAANTVRNAVLPLRAIYRRAIQLGEVVANPTSGLSMPSDRSRRSRVSPPEEVEALLDAVLEGDRALWTTAMYAGLRRGELMALQWESIDLDEGVISVVRSWDRIEGEIEPKSRAGRRRVPIPAVLRAQLIAHRLRQGNGGTGFALSRTGERPFEPSAVLKRAKLAFARAGLEPVCLHDCRHTYASLMIAAGVNTKALSSYMGHSSITVTLDRYGHLLPGSEREAASLLDAYVGQHALAEPEPTQVHELPLGSGALRG